MSNAPSDKGGPGLPHRAIIDAMSDNDKVRLLSGSGRWRTAAFPAFGLAAITMTDGTYGVRYSVTQIDNSDGLGTGLEEFLATADQHASAIYRQSAEIKPATCFPNGSAMGNSWDVALLEELGTLLGRESRAKGVNLLLGPGINIRRNPLAGRAYEYYSEDPYLTGKLAAGLIRGVQSQGVGSSLKHLACYNAENERMTTDSVVEERALREIYLRGFEIAIRESHPWTVMSSYNLLNGTPTAQNHWLLTDVLRGEWGFDGMTISDWNSVKDRPAALAAGLDLDMPQSERRMEALRTALVDGTVSRTRVDQACSNVLQLLEKARKGAETPYAPFTAEQHHARARAMAASAMVLVKNDGALPIRGARRIIVAGQGAAVPVIQGSGGATTLPTMLDVPLDELRLALGEDVEVIHLPEVCDENLALARSADIVVVFVSSDGRTDGEGNDRTSLQLSTGHREMVEHLAVAGIRMVVVVASPDVVEMPWIDAANAVLMTFYSGQASGGAVADILSGRVNPSGKLSVSVPHRLEDVPGFLSYPPELDRHVYAEGIHVGYRGYRKRRSAPLLPFGHGLSYASFAYSEPKLSAAAVGIRDKVTLSFTLTNTGSLAGSEVSQVYLQAKGQQVLRSDRELKGFAKTWLEPGESGVVTVDIEGRDLTVWHSKRQQWVLEGEAVQLLIGASSADIRASIGLDLKPSILPWPKVERHTRPAFILPNPHARAILRDDIARRVGISPEDADKALMGIQNSVFGIFASLERYLRISIPDSAVTDVFERINAAIDAAELTL